MVIVYILCHILFFSFWEGKAIVVVIVSFVCLDFFLEEGKAIVDVCLYIWYYLCAFFSRQKDGVVDDVSI